MVFVPELNFVHNYVFLKAVSIDSSINNNIHKLIFGKVILIYEDIIKCKH